MGKDCFQRILDIYDTLPKQQKLMWHTAQIDADGARYYLSFHADGSVWEFKKF